MTVFFLSILVFSKWRDEFRAFMYMYIYLLNSQYLARSCPSSLSSRSLGPFSLVHTGAMAMETPWSLAPISAPHIQAGLLRITAWVFLTWSTSMYVHFNKRKLKHWLFLMNFGVQYITCKHHFAMTLFHMLPAISSLEQPYFQERVRYTSLTNTEPMTDEISVNIFQSQWILLR